MGFIPLWDAAFSTDNVGVASPRIRGVRCVLQVSAPFRRTFVLGFESEETRDTFRRVMEKIRLAGRANDAMWMNSWWRSHISKTGEDRVPWGRFAAALVRSLKVRLQLDVEATLCYLLNSLHRNDVREVPSLEVVTLASLVEFSYLFGSLVDALENFDGVLQALTACSLAYAQKMVVGAAPGTFVLYLASRPTSTSLAVLGLVFVNSRSKVQHKHIFRDPVSRRFFTDFGEPAFNRLDHTVACAIGCDDTFARQTRLKLDEMERIKAMICSQQKRLVDQTLEQLPVNNASPRAARVPLHQARSSPLLSRPAVSLKLKSSGDLFDEIDQLLDDDQEEPAANILESTSEGLLTLETSQQSLDRLQELSVIEALDDHDTSEMMLKNMYCLSCGAQLDGSGKFTTCAECGHFMMEKLGDKAEWTENEAGSGSEVKDIHYSFVKNDTLSAAEVEAYLSREHTRKRTMLGISKNLAEWSEEASGSVTK